MNTTTSTSPSFSRFRFLLSDTLEVLETIQLAPDVDYSLVDGADWAELTNDYVEVRLQVAPAGMIIETRPKGADITSAPVGQATLVGALATATVVASTVAAILNEEA